MYKNKPAFQYFYSCSYQIGITQHYIYFDVINRDDDKHLKFVSEFVLDGVGNIIIMQYYLTDL